MQLDTTAIQRIVSDVLKELSTRADALRAVPAEDVQQSALIIDEAVITADVLEERLNGRQTISIAGKALLTPSAQDLIRERNVHIQRMAPAPAQTAGQTAMKFIVVGNHPSIDDLQADIRASREPADTADEAAKLAISGICRGEADRVVVLTDKPHRAACLANRNDRIRASVLSDARDIGNIAAELSANVWCINPAGRSSFELARLCKAVNTTHYPLPTTH